MTHVYNTYTGLGVSGQDKTLYDQPYDAGPPDLNELYAFYHGYSLAQRVVEVPVDDVLKASWEFSPVDGSAGLVEAVKDYLEERLFEFRIREGMVNARLYGGGGVIINVDDGRELDEPIDLDNIETIRSFAPFDRYEMVAIQYSRDLRSPWYKEPELFSFIPFVPGVFDTRPFNAAPSEEDLAVASRVHASRVIVFPGKNIPVRLRWDNRGFSDSVLRALRAHVLDVARVFRCSAQIVYDFAETIIKSPDVIAQLEAPEPNVYNVDQANNQVNAFLSSLKRRTSFNGERYLDSDEEITKLITPTSGIRDLLDIVILPPDGQDRPSSDWHLINPLNHHPRLAAQSAFSVSLADRLDCGRLLRTARGQAAHGLPRS